MTPKRKAYILKCSYKETLLRCLINGEKAELKHFKLMRRVNDDGLTKKNLRESKWFLAMYRHELARFKGMNRVAKPRDVRFGILTGIKYANCICGCDLSEGKSFCSNCGRRILWEKGSNEPN